MYKLSLFLPLSFSYNFFRSPNESTLWTVQCSLKDVLDNAFSGNTGFLIQCSRGSAASAFRIRNKLPGEYIAKTKTEVKNRPASRKTKLSVGDGLAGLSDEEFRVIMEIRRKKLAKKKAEESRSFHKQ